MTGGQAALSLDEEKSDGVAAADNIAFKSRPEGLKLRVIRATSEEMIAHDALLDKMQESGDCVYRDTGLQEKTKTR
jgi:hypothetical protein